MTWAVLKCGKEKVFMDMRDVLFMQSRGGKATDVYTTLFIDGITIDHDFESLVETYAMVMMEDEDEEANEDGSGESNDGSDLRASGCATCGNGECDCGYGDGGTFGSTESGDLIHSDKCGDDDD